MKKVDFENLKDGAVIIYDGMYAFTRYGIFNKKESEQCGYTRIYGWWGKSIVEAHKIKAFDVGCKKLDWSPPGSLRLYKTQCMCPMLVGGGIDHEDDCPWWIKKYGRAS